jgi:AcrR family transcriptional regulator
MTMSGASQRTRRRPRAQVRSDLLDAAARAFARQSYAAVSVEAVSAEAGLSTGALYSNFAGKEDLFLSLYEERIERRGRELRDAVAGSGGGRGGLRAAMENVAELLYGERDWFLLYFEFLLHAARNPAFAKRFRATREQGLAELAEGIARGLHDAGLAASVDAIDLARAISALTYGMALERLLDEQAPAASVLTLAVEAMIRGAAIPPTTHT